MFMYVCMCISVPCVIFSQKKGEEDFEGRKSKNFQKERIESNGKESETVKSFALITSDSSCHLNVNVIAIYIY